MADALEDEYDVILVGTGLPESIVAAACARNGMSVLHLDENEYYGGRWASLGLRQFVQWTELAARAPPLSVDVDKVQAAVDAAQASATDVHVIRCPPLDGATGVTSAAALAESVREAAVMQTPRRVPPLANLQSPMQSPLASPAQSPHVHALDLSAAGDDGDGDGDGDDGDVAIESGDATAVAAAADDPDTPLGRLMVDARKYNIDLAGKVVFCGGSFVQLLIKSGVSSYLEFKAVESSCLFADGSLHRVPCSKADVFKTTFLKLTEKRALMKFFQYCQSIFGQDDGAGDGDGPGPEAEAEDKSQGEAEAAAEGAAQAAADAGKAIDLERPFVDFLKEQKLNERLCNLVLYAIVMAEDEAVPTRVGLDRMKLYLQSLGRYGTTAFLAAYYGVSEWPQAFARLCAVNGGTYCLRRAPAYVLTREGAFAGIVCNEGQHIRAKYLVSSQGALARELTQVREGTDKVLVRCVCSPDRSIHGSEGIVVATIPPDERVGRVAVINVVQLDHSAASVPEGKFLLYFATEGLSAKSTSDSLLRQVASLVDLSCDVPGAGATVPVLDAAPGDAATAGGAAALPRALWYWSFTQPIGCVESHVDNVFVCQNPDASLTAEDVVDQARAIFETICPDAEFLPKPEKDAEESLAAAEQEAANLQSQVERVQAEFGGASVADDGAAGDEA